MCGQQCIMNRQEHYRSLERDVAWEKNQDPTSMTVPKEKDDLSLSTNYPQGIYLHYGFNLFF